MPASAVIRFAHLRGHKRVCDDLRTAAKQARLAHALLFAGPEGIGKRSAALALAAWQQCETGDDDACGECGACRQVAAGSHPDVQVVAVASGKKEIGVERARALKRFTQLRPSRGKGKLAIIDDAHMLTIAAQNALLKTLEEPPDHSLLILVANNADALLPTVRSRCQRVRFAPLPTDAVVDILTTHHGLDTAAANAMAALAEGSPGRALALHAGLAGRQPLDQQLATLGTARYVHVMQLAEALRQPENLTAMKLEALLAAYRDAALRAVGAGHLVRHDAPSDHATFSARDALQRADAVQAAWTAVRRGNPNRQLLLETLLLGLARS